jgi:hypothetical protein
MRPSSALAYSSAVSSPLLCRMIAQTLARGVLDAVIELACEEFEPLLCFFALCNVDANADKPGGPLILVLHEGAVPEGQPMPIAVAHPIFELELLARPRSDLGDRLLKNGRSSG